MSVQTLLHLEALNHARQELQTYEGKLENLIRTDIEKAKVDLTEVVAHFKAEVVRLVGLIPTRVMAHVEEGVHPTVAVERAAEPTRAETASRILQEQALNSQGQSS